MKKQKTALLCILLAFAAFSFASEKKAKENAKNTSIETRPEVKPIAAEWQPSVFDGSIGRLPSDYIGNNPEKFLSKYKSKLAALIKGEYETTNEYLERTNNKDLLLFPFNTKDLYAFRLYGVPINYDADSQRFVVKKKFACEDSPADKNWITCDIASIRSYVDTYESSNKYGISQTIYRTKGLTFAIGLQKESSGTDSAIKKEPRSLAGYSIDDSFHIPIEKAKEIKGVNISILVVGRIKEAKIIEGKGLIQTSTPDSPLETTIKVEAIPFQDAALIYFVEQTGEILHKKNFKAE